MNIFKKSINALTKTRKKIKNVFSNITSFSKLAEEEILSIEDCLLSSDIGWELTDKVISQIRKSKISKDAWEKSLMEILKKGINEISELNNDLKQIIIIIGVNGSGKTTTSAKLARYYKNKNKKVTLVAADTYRAAAVEQLNIWSKRLNIDFISNYNTSDPASVAYDGASSGISKKHDHVIIDTAGRLHTSKNLMQELEKIYRIVNRLTKNISVCITLDANIGQNSIKQVEEFNKYLPINNIILNKMDGTAKGGIALSILNKLGIPISFLGIGESYDDLIEFNLDNYLSSLIRE